MITVIIVDDIKEIRDYLCEILEQEEDRIKVVATASTGFEAVNLVEKLRPNIVLMDIQMETRMAGIDSVEKIHKLYPETKCIMLTIHENDEYLFRAYMVGASDYIVKTKPSNEIIKSIYDVMENNLMLRPEVAQKIISEYKRIQSTHTKMRDALQVMMLISATEYEILKLVYYGYTYKNIAKLRFVEETTVRSQVNHILKKFKKKRMKDVIELLKELNIFDEE